MRGEVAVIREKDCPGDIHFYIGFFGGGLSFVEHFGGDAQGVGLGGDLGFFVKGMLRFAEHEQAVTGEAEGVIG